MQGPHTRTECLLLFMQVRLERPVRPRNLIATVSIRCNKERLWKCKFVTAFTWC